MKDKYIKVCECIYNYKLFDYIYKYTNDQKESHYILSLNDKLFHIPFSEDLLKSLAVFLNSKENDGNVFDVDFHF